MYVFNLRRLSDVLNFQFYQRVKLVYGNGSLDQIGELVASIGAKKVFVICDAGIMSTGMVERTTKSLDGVGIGHVIFDKALPNPPVAIVEEGAERCKMENCDCVIGIGGGSNIDTAKAINCLRFNDGPIIRFDDMNEPMNPSPGLIIIPTTAGTGSEVSDGIVLSDEYHNKHPMLATNAMADYAILDPELMVGMPRKLTMATGLDAFAHAVESYTSNVANEFVDFFVEKSIDTVVEYLPRAIENGHDLEARGKMAICSTIGGWMLGYGHTHAGHSFGHVIGGIFDVPHGIACMAAEPYVIEFNAPAIPERTKKLAERLGAKFNGDETPEKIGAIARDALLAFRDEKAKMTSIKEFPYDKDKFTELAIDIEKEMFQFFNPRKMRAEDALAILKKIYA
jgi:Alcohol dehydrogenase, class IV